MFTRKFSGLAAAVMLAMGAAGAVHAAGVSTTDYKILFDNYDSGTTYYTGFSGGGPAGPDTNGVKCGALGGGAAAIASCDTRAALVGGTAPGSIGSVNTSADTMGIISISSITRLSDGATLFSRGTATTIGSISVGPYLTGVFGNLSDYYAETAFCATSGCTTTAFGSGGTFRIWSNTTDYNVAQGPLVSANTDLNALKYAPSVSNGTLFLGGNFVAGGAVSTDTAASYVSTFLDATVSGSGVGFLDFTEGAARAIFDTNGQLTNNASGTQFADAKLSNTYFPDPKVPQWTVFSSGQVTGSIVPEPGSLALASLALLALGVTAGRRNKKA